MLKTGVSRPGLGAEWPLSLINPHTLVGLVAFGLAVTGYAGLLRQLPLNVAQSVFSLQFVAVIVASAAILGEPISPTRWLGIALIVAGILVVAWTSDAV
jgi:drug/metabolite transporter (DMT)-like permease